MSAVVPDNPAVAFYENRNRLRIDRELEFSPALPDLPEWVEPEELIDPDEMDAYTELCRLAIAKTTRVLFLPQEHTFSRALVTGLADLSYKPTGGYCEVIGPNFKVSLSMGDVDFAHHGLCYSGASRGYLNLGNTPSVDGHFRLTSVTDEDDGYHRLAIGQGACVINRGARYGERVAGPDVVRQWTEEVLVPIEEEIKAQAYEWLGDDKTDPYAFSRLV